MRRGSLAFLFALFAFLAVASAYPQMPTPAPELKKLDFMAGDWTTEGTFVPGPPGTPPSQFTTTSHLEWMDGNFFLVAHSNSDLEGMGKMSDMAVMGYDPDRKVYTNTYFSSMGQNETSTGTVDGDTWTWTGDSSYGGMTFKGRMTMKVLSPTAYTMKFEISPDGSTWSTAMEGKATKK